MMTNKGGIEMAKKTGLGKGLDALFATPVIEEERIRENETVLSLKLNQIEPNKEQARKIFNEESLEELANSIKEYGLIQPIIVTKKEKYYEIIAGERRWRASKKAGLEEIPVIVREDNEKINREISLIENIQREDLNPIEKAKGIKVLLDEHGLTQQQLADKLGMSRSSIGNTVRILNLDEKVIELALQGKLSEGHCKSLMSIEDPERQYQLALHIIESGDSVRAMEKKINVRKKVSKRQDRFLPMYREMEESFQRFFGTKVRLEHGERKGKIVIQYTSHDDLNRIIELIKS